MTALTPIVVTAQASGAPPSTRSIAKGRTGIALITSAVSGLGTGPNAVVEHRASESASGRAVGMMSRDSFDFIGPGTNSASVAVNDVRFMMTRFGVIDGLIEITANDRGTTKFAVFGTSLASPVILPWAQNGFTGPCTLDVNPIVFVHLSPVARRHQILLPAGLIPATLRPFSISTQIISAELSTRVDPRAPWMVSSGPIVLTL